jgi:hypothetical protein
MMLDKSGIERFRLMSFDGVFDDEPRELLKVFFCTRLEGDDGV